VASRPATQTESIGARRTVQALFPYLLIIAVFSVAAQKAASASNRWFGKRTTLGALRWPMSGWSAARDTPVPPKESFRDWWKRERGPQAGGKP
jgi:hypothetical protein